MNDLMQKLVEAYGPSGFEDQMRALIRPEIEPFVDQVSTDVMGKLYLHSLPLCPFSK